jgi:hypothetical protein
MPQTRTSEERMQETLLTCRWLKHGWSVKSFKHSIVKQRHVGVYALACIRCPKTRSEARNIQSGKLIPGTRRYGGITREAEKLALGFDTADSAAFVMGALIKADRRRQHAKKQAPSSRKATSSRRAA